MHMISIYRSIPESVVSFGIALAISAMAFPSCCIRDTVGGDVGTDEGENVGTNEGVAVVGVDVGTDEGENVGVDACATVVLVVIVTKRTTPMRKCRFIMIPVATRQRKCTPHRF